MLEQPVSRAYLAGTPAGSRCQMISPRGVCRPRVNSIARRTAGHIRATKAASPVTWYSYQTPTATYAAWLLSPTASDTWPPGAVRRGQEPSGRCVASSHS